MNELEASMKRRLEDYPAQEKRLIKTNSRKKQKITKTEMAKYENSWRMAPFEVKQGAQEKLGFTWHTRLAEEWEKDSTRFQVMFFRDLVAKAILFRQADRIVQYEAVWYKNRL